MPDLSHLWQRFVLASALIFGLALGVAATIFGYSNTASVNISWAVWHVNGIPLWTVGVVPLVLVMLAGTLYHWYSSLHHFTEHMRHRRRVHELEDELAKLRAHLDQVLEMPDHSTETLPDNAAPTAAETPALPAMAVQNGDDGAAKKARKRISLAVSETEPIAVPATSEVTAETEPREETPADA